MDGLIVSELAPILLLDTTYRGLKNSASPIQGVTNIVGASSARSWRGTPLRLVEDIS